MFIYFVVLQVLFYFVDDQVIVDVSTDVFTVKEDLHTIIQNISHVIVASDDGKQLRCVADHPGLSAANNYAQQTINVKCKSLFSTSCSYYIFVVEKFISNELHYKFVDLNFNLHILTHVLRIYLFISKNIIIEMLQLHIITIF